MKMPFFPCDAFLPTNGFLLRAKPFPPNTRAVFFFLVCYKVWLSVRFNKLTTDFHISQTHRLWMKPLSYELFGSASLIWSFKPKKKKDHILVFRKCIISVKYIRPADGWKVFVLLRGNTAPTWLSCTMTLCSSDLAKHYYLESCY